MPRRHFLNALFFDLLLLDRLSVLELFNSLLAQAQNLTKYLLVMRADPRRRMRGAGGR